MRLNLRQIEAFRAVFQTNSMTAAAELMGVTQPAISRLIRDLEAEIDLPLFDRTRGRLISTQNAAALYREVDRSFYGLERISRAAAALHRRPTGNLRLAAAIAPSFYWLPELIKTFNSERSGIGISLNVLPSMEVLDAVSMQQYDFGLADVPANASGVDIEPLRGLEFVCVLPTGHRLLEKTILGPKDFAGESVLMISPDSHQQHHIVNAFASENVDLDIMFEASNSGPICALVSQGAGLSIVDPISARAFSGQGVELRRFSPAVPYELKLVYPANRPRSDQTKAFAELVKSELLALHIPT